MPEKSFIQLGIKNGETFDPKALRACDVFASNDVSAEQHISDDTKHLTAEQAARITGAVQATLLGVANGVATLGADGKINPAQVDETMFDVNVVVGTFAELMEQTNKQAPLKSVILVEDATGDPSGTVTSGWAVYFRKALTGTNTPSDFFKIMEGEGLDVNFTALETAIQAAQTTANNAATAVAAADDKAVVAQTTADSAATAAATADGKAVAADTKAANAATAAATAQTTAESAATEAALLDFAYCENEADMATKNLRPGALVLMHVEN